MVFWWTLNSLQYSQTWWIRTGRTSPRPRREKGRLEKRARVREEKIGWWRENRVLFPVLAGVARSVFGSRPTSANIERAFSSGRHLMGALRSRLLPQRVEVWMFLHLNRAFLKSAWIVHFSTFVSAIEHVISENMLFSHIENTFNVLRTCYFQNMFNNMFWKPNTERAKQ